jgi:hypothetical protein
MIANRYRLTPQQKQKLNAKANELQCISDLSDSQYLIMNRLRELTVLVSEKNNQLVNTRTRLAQRGTSHVLERELTEQREQVEDLIHLADDWLKLLSLSQKTPLQNDLSEVLQEMLRSLGLDIHVNLSRP